MKFVIVVLGLILTGTVAHAQVGDMPSHAELDPILDNADVKLKDFLATLAEFKLEANALDQDRLTDDFKSVQQLREMIRKTHSSIGVKSSGVNMQRLVGILSGIDDMALDAGPDKLSQR